MSLENLVSVTFSDKELHQLAHGINAIKEVLFGKAINFTAEQRKQYERIANQNKLIVDKAKSYMEQHLDWIPPFLDKEEFDRDYATQQQIETHVQLLENLSQQLIDTKTLIGYTNYSSALSFYRMMRYLAGKNEPGATSVYQDMKVLFEKNGTSPEDIET